VSDAWPVRRPLISGNWKMNFDHHEALHAARDLGLRLQPGDLSQLDVSLHPPFTDLRTVQSVLEPDQIPVALGAQNCAIEDAGPFTGEVSPLMLAKLHVEYVIVGHSERRTMFWETDEVVQAKIRAVIRNGMTPICCVGETLEEREEGSTEPRLASQVEAALGGLAAEAVANVVIAYEPLWAIGSGLPATPEDAQQACGWIRQVVGRCAGSDAATSVRIQYGGSVNEENTESIVRGPDIDGALVGGASLDNGAFLGIIRAAVRARQ
jgi:triosephosphate isomerase (TIM)